MKASIQLRGFLRKENCRESIANLQEGKTILVHGLRKRKNKESISKIGKGL